MQIDFSPPKSAIESRKSDETSEDTAVGQSVPSVQTRSPLSIDNKVCVEKYSLPYETSSGAGEALTV